MVDPTNPAGPVKGEPGLATASGPESPEEPFPCPACGQMLAPSVRVCVACKHPIDPREIRRSRGPVPSLEPRAILSAAPRTPFPWLLFFICLAARFMAAYTLQQRWGFGRVELALGAMEVVTASWVFFDARALGVPRPLRWALGVLLVWIVTFPWYLVRRKALQSSCPLVEGEISPLVRALLLLLAALVLAGALGYFLKFPPH